MFDCVRAVWVVDIYIYVCACEYRGGGPFGELGLV